MFENLFTKRKPNGDYDRKEKQAEIALVDHWRTLLDETLRSERYEQQHKRINRWQKYVTGEAYEDMTVQVNLIMSTLNTVIPHIYARNPEIAALPAPAVSDERYEQVRGFAQTVEIINGRELDDAYLKRMIKRQVRQTMTTATGWLKLGFQRITGKDENPEITRRIEDLQDNERHLEALLNTDTEGMGEDEREQRKAEIAANLKTLTEQAEVIVSQGTTLDKVGSKDILIDPALRELADYRWAGWIAQRFWYTAAQLQDEYGLDEKVIKSAAVWKGDKGSGEDQAPNTTGDWYCVWEIWSKTDGVVYTLLEGYECWVKQPFVPHPATQRFYPFFLLAFNWVDDEFWPISDVQMWEGLQDEYNRTRNAYAEHRRRTIPARVGRGDQVSATEASKLADPERNELVLLEKANIPVDQAVGVLKYPPVDSGLYDTSVIRSDLESVSGIQDAARGAVYQAKTATEARIQQSGLVTRLTDKQDEIEEEIQELARAVAEMTLQMYSQADAVRIAGEGAVWPQMSRAELYDQVRINIRAGTSGKPDQQREQETWSLILPLVQDTLMQIQQLRAAGQSSYADAYIELLRETLRRADERLDLDRFIPDDKSDPFMQVMQLLQQSGHGEVAQQLMSLLQSSAPTQSTSPPNQPTPPPQPMGA